jgi:hypothetical protein
MKGKKSRHPKPRAKPKVKEQSPSELSEDQLEQVAGGGGLPATVAGPTAATVPTDFSTVQFAFQTIEISGPFKPPPDGWKA